jgi:integrase
VDAERRGVAASTLTQYRRAAAKLTAALIEFAPHEVRPTHVAALLDHWAATPNAANRARTVLRLAFNRAVRTGLVDSNPVASIARLPEAKRTRYLSDVELAAIRTAASPTLRAIIDLAYLTAQRIGDVLAIREADIGPEGIAIDQRKTGRRLLLAWTPDLRAAVDGARQLHATRKLWLLAQRNGKPRAYSGVRDLWDRACARAQVADAHLHDLRAKSLTDAKRQGLDPQPLAGHSSPAMTARYLRSRERDLVTGPRFRQV